MSDPNRVLAIVTVARGLFFKPLYEAIAESMPESWSVVLIRPKTNKPEHPEELLTPSSPKIHVFDVESSAQTLVGSDGKLEKRSSRYETFLPSRELKEKLAEVRPAILLLHEYSPFTLYGLYYAKRHGLPVLVSSEVGKSNEHYFSLRTRVLHRVWGRWVDGVLPCCPSAHQLLSGKILPRYSTYHAMDSATYRPISKPASQATTFVYLGRYNRRKGLDLFLEAAAKLKASTRSAFKLKLVGYGDEAWLKSEIQRLDLVSETEVTGFLSGQAVIQALGTSDVFVLPTRQDTYGAVVQEAACMGLPLLISKHAGAAEALVRPSVNGFIMDPEDTSAFTGYMGELLNPELRRKMGQAARSTGEEFCARRRGAGVWPWIKQHWFGNE